MPDTAAPHVTPPPLLQAMPPRPRPRRLAAIGIGVVVVLAAVGVHGLHSRANATAELVQVARQAAVPSVSIVQPSHDVHGQVVELPGTIQAFYNAPIYARVPGYLKAWYDDIGARVKQGQVLAVIDTPDLDRELDQAKADLNSAIAQDRLARLTATRWKALLNTQAVSRQTVDEKIGAAEAQQANVAAAQAKMQRLEAMESFKRLVAPFDGIVTARRTDIGDLIAPGDAGKELFQVSDVHEMRIYVRVPQAYSGMLKPGLIATLTMPQYPGRTFSAKLLTTSDAVAEDSRTLLVELLAPNPDEALQPGNFAEVSFQLPPDPNLLHLPATAVIFGQHGMQVAVLGPDDHVVIKPVEIGEDLGSTMQVLSGVSPTDKVIDSPPETLANNEVVQLATDKPVEDAGAARPNKQVSLN